MNRTALSTTILPIVQRLFADPIFRDDALANPGRAFENFSLDEEERQAVKSFLGTMVRHNEILSMDLGLETFWGF